MTNVETEKVRKFHHSVILHFFKRKGRENEEAKFFFFL